MPDIIWTPHLGEVVKYTATYTWPEARRGKPSNIRQATVKKVSAAGYVSVSGSQLKFLRSAPRRFSERRLKNGDSGFHSFIEPATADEAVMLPTHALAGAAFARDVNGDHQDGEVSPAQDAAQLTDAQLIDAGREISGYFTRPGELEWLVDEVRAKGVTYVFQDGDHDFRVVHPDGDFTFSVPLEPLAAFIGYCVSKPEVITAALLLVRACRERSEIEPADLERVLAKLRVWGGNDPSPPTKAPHAD